MKKLLLLPLALLALTPMAYADFPDVPATSEYHQSVSALEDLGIVKGYPDGTFKLDQPVNRAEFLKMAYLAESKRNPDRPRSWENPEIFPFNDLGSIGIEPPCFNDFLALRIKPTRPQWFEQLACWGKEEGLVKGYGGGNFDPLRTVNFAEAAKILIETSGESALKGDDVEHWAKDYIEALNKGRMIPFSIENAGQPLNRAMAAQLIYNYNQANFESLQSQTSNALIWDGQEYVLFENLGIAARYYQLLKKDGQIYYTYLFGLDGSSHHDPKKLENVDVASFQTYQYYDQHTSYSGSLKYAMAGVATDRFSVLDVSLKPIEGSAGGPFQFFEETFQAIPDNYIGYGRDDKYVYLINCYEGCWPEILPSSNADDFEAIGNGFSRSGDQYYYLSRPIKLPINPDGLEFLTPVLGKQGEKVYYFQSDMGEDWQLREFDYLGVAYRYGDTIEHYMTDGENVFMLDSAYTKLIQVEGADANSFQLAPFVDGLSIALDNTALYKGSAKIEGSAGGSFKIIGESFEVFPGAGFYGGDDGNIYYIRCLEGCDISSLINGGDIDSLKYLGEGYAADANQVYYAGEIIDVDRESFTYLGEGYVTDKDGVYYHHANNVKDEFSLIPEADLESFQLNLANDEDLFCTFPFAKDGKNIFLAGRVMNEIDYDSFEFLDSNGFFFKDKNGFYRLGLLGESHLCKARSWAEIKESKLASADLVLAEQAVDYFETYSADLSTLQVLNPHYFSVENRVYYMDDFGQIFLVKRADKNSFETLIQTPEDYAGINHSHLAKDLIHSYHNQDVIPLEIDAESFEYDQETTILQDKNRQYALYEIEKMLEECVGKYIPVCGEVDGELQSFRNSCLAKKAGSTNITDGLCTQQETIWAQACFSSNPFARWRPEWNYCEDIDEQTCNEIGGKEFEECGSGCSPYDDSDICPSVCAEICFF